MKPDPEHGGKPECEKNAWVAQKKNKSIPNTKFWSAELVLAIRVLISTSWVATCTLGSHKHKDTRRKSSNFVPKYLSPYRLYRENNDWDSSYGPRTSPIMRLYHSIALGSLSGAESGTPFEQKSKCPNIWVANCLHSLQSVKSYQSQPKALSLCVCIAR
jgi:hypothetical protein